jgi:hypothetical protein
MELSEEDRKAFEEESRLAGYTGPKNPKLAGEEPEFDAWFDEVLRDTVHDPNADPKVREAARKVLGRPTMGDNKPSGNSPLWQTRVPRDLDRRAKEYAAQQQITLAEVVRRAVRQFLDQGENSAGQPVPIG